ncbi:MAG: AAA family ATPase [Gammaproteobacteria bacterium]
MNITAIDIRNFRSIVSFNDKVQDINIFVGANDGGKSNVLRALDLFFNGGKRHGYEFDWARDYCAFAPPKVKAVEEVIVELEVTPPRTFSNNVPVLWRKVWRKGGIHRESIRHEDRSELSSRSKLPAFLNAIRYDYVPAIKGEDYFQTLMTNLYDMLEATVEEQVRQASGSFTETINKYAIHP